MRKALGCNTTHQHNRQPKLSAWIFAKAVYLCRQPDITPSTHRAKICRKQSIKPLYPTPNSVMRFYSAIKQCKDDAAADANSRRRRRDRRPSDRKAACPGQYRKRRKEAWRTVLRGNGRNQGKSPKRSLSRNSSYKTRKTSQKPPQKNNAVTTRRYIACICSSAFCRGKTTGAYNGVGRTASP